MKTVVLGAGVGGLFFSNLYKGESLIVDKNDQAGRKLLATGNGRCNFTNLSLKDSYYHSQNEGFFSYALKEYDNHDLIDFLNKKGILTTHLPSGRCYPQTQSARTIRDILYKQSRGKFLFEKDITDIDFKKRLLITEDDKIYFDKLIIATGGMTLPGTGSDGSIFDILRPYHKISRLTYGITNYGCKNPLSKKAKGVRVSARASLFIDGHFIKSSDDDIIFQTYGLTGTAILDLSNDISYGLLDKKDIRIKVDLLKDYDEERLYGILKSIIARSDSLYDLLLGFLNKKLIDDVLKRAGLSPKIKARKLKDADLKRLIRTVKGLEFRVENIHDRENAQVTIGGIDTKEVDNKIFESKILKGVYFIGEVLDVDGACGGYNIQWAYSSAKACASALNKDS